MDDVAHQKNSYDMISASNHNEKEERLTGESKIDPTKFILIGKMNRFPICFIISLLGN